MNLRHIAAPQANTVIPQQPKIIAETKNYLIVNKPAGMLSHPATLPYDEFTLADWAVQYSPQIKTVGDDARMRPGIMHRLDKEVSGLMIIAKTQSFFDYIKTQFQMRRITKTYLALVYGKMPREQGVIELPIARHTREPRMAVRGKGQTGKYAYTEYLVLKQLTTCALLKVHIETGRTHQIRAHLHAYGHPIVGDTLYMNKKFKPIKTCGLCLQAVELSFIDFDGVTRSFTIPPLPLFSKFL